MTRTGKDIYQVSLRHAHELIQFPCHDNESIAKAAQRAGFDLTLGCMQSRCMTCRAVLREGKVHSLRPLSRYATIDPAAIDGGYALLCSVGPSEDVILEPTSSWQQLTDE